MSKKKLPINFSEHTLEELQVVAEDVVNQKVYGSWMIANLISSPKRLGHIFRPVALAYAVTGVTRSNEWNPKSPKFILSPFKKGYPKADNIRHFYEYRDKAEDPHFKDSEWPMFKTCRALNSEEVITLTSCMEKYQRTKIN